MTEREHHGKERGRYALSGERDARAIDQNARLDTLLFGKGAQHLLRGSLGEFGRGTVAATELYQQVAGGGVLEKFRHRGGIKAEIVAEVGTKGCGEIKKAARAGFHELDRREDFSLAAGGDEAGLAPFGLDRRQQLVRARTADPLRVEPGQLVVIKDGVGFRDAFEREELDELLGAEDFTVAAIGVLTRSARRPTEQREEVTEGLGHDAHVFIRSDGGGA